MIEKGRHVAQDSSGTDSSVSPLDNTSERCSEMGENEAAMPSSALFPRRSLHTNHDICTTLPDVCLFSDNVLGCLDDPTNYDDTLVCSLHVRPHTVGHITKIVFPLQDAKSNVGWMKEEEQEREEVRYVKEEHPMCPTITSHYAGNVCSFLHNTCK